MVNYIGWKEAQARVQHEPVIFAEVLSHYREGQMLEVHVMAPTSRGVHELERDDTERIPGEEVDAVISRIAAGHGVRYATIRRAEDHWPPDWVI